jgi:hypothetical protein
MNSDLRKTIQNFITNYHKKVDDINIFGKSDNDLTYCYLFLDKAINLLQKCVVDDYNIPKEQDQ